MNRLLFTLFALFALATTAHADDMKIGAVNVELVLTYMPATKAMQQSLTTLQQKLGEGLRVKQNYAQVKMQEYMEKRQGGAAEAELKPLEDELQKLDQELQKASMDAEGKLAAKREELMEPITAQLEKAVKAVVARGGYTHVFNTVDGAGVSIVLHMPEGDDLTRDVLNQLGVVVPQAPK